MKTYIKKTSWSLEDRSSSVKLQENRLVFITILSGGRKGTGDFEEPLHSDWQHLQVTFQSKGGQGKGDESRRHDQNV